MRLLFTQAIVGPTTVHRVGARGNLGLRSALLLVAVGGWVACFLCLLLMFPYACCSTPVPVLCCAVLSVVCRCLDALITMGVLVPTGDRLAVRRTAQFFLNSFQVST